MTDLAQSAWGIIIPLGCLATPLFAFVVALYATRGQS